MNEEMLTKELQSFDFSQCHPVREKLLDKLLQRHRADNKSIRRKAAARMSDEALDLVAAAGTIAPRQEQDEDKLP